MSDRPLSDGLPSSFDENEDYQETPVQKMVRKLKAEPLIPLGALLTVAAFTSAARATRQGDRRKAQRMFRARVAAQGFTILAMVAGGFYYGRERQQERELWNLQQKQKEEEKRTRWIRELEARDAEEKALQEEMARRRGVRRAAEAGGQPGGQAAGGEGGASGGRSALGSVGGWFGFGGGKPAEADPDRQAPPPPPPAAPAEPAAAPADAAVPEARRKGKGTSSLGTLGELFSKKPGDKDDK